MPALPHNMLLPAIACFALLVSQPGQARTPQLVAAVLESGPPVPEQRCAYTRTSIDEDGSKTERYDPDDPEGPWTLIDIDGRAPTQGELRRYAGKADDRIDRRHPLAFDLRELVSPDGWRLLSETEREAVFQFRLRPSEELDERLVDKVVGTLVLDKVRLQPTRIRIANTEPAYVAPLVRIAEYSQDLHFDWSDALDGPVLVSTDTHRRGRALGIKSLRKNKLVRYGDYQCRAPVPQSAGR